MNTLQYSGWLAALLLTGVLCPRAGAQGVPHESSRVRLPVLNRFFPGVQLTEALDYSFQTTLFTASAQAGTKPANLLALTHEIRYAMKAGWRQRWSLSCELYHQLGFQYFFDSIHQVSIDENLLRIASDYSPARRLGIRASAEFRSRLLNEQVFLPNDSGHLVKTRRGSFLTPLQIQVLAGVTWNQPGLGSVTLSLSGLKITWLRDPGVFQTIRDDQFHGVNRGKTLRLEYGLTLKTVFSRQLLRLVDWDLDLQLFKNFNDPWDLELRNHFSIRLTRFLKVSLKTRLLYESSIYDKLMVENHLAAGLFFRP